MRHIAAHLRFWSVVVGGLALDLWSKEWAFHTLRQGGVRPLIPSILEFHTTLNPGALFGIGAGQTTLFVVASLLALLLVLWMFAQCPARRWFMQVALGAILAGALGNMYDRIFVRLVPQVFQTAAGRSVLYCVPSEADDGQMIVLTEYPPTDHSLVRRVPRSAAGELPPPVGYVRDFIHILRQWKLWPWVFNVADMLLVGGVGVLAIRLLRERSTQVRTTQSLDAVGGKT